MPEDKKPPKSSRPAPKTPATRATPAARVTRAATSRTTKSPVPRATRSTPASTSRSSSAPRPAPKPRAPSDAFDEPLEDRPVASAGPVAVGWTAEPAEPDVMDPEPSAPTWGAPVEEPGPEAPEAVEAAVVERPWLEVLVGVACLAVSALVFTNWYTAPGRHLSGWTSGRWGPVVFVVGLLGATIVALRRLKIPVTFPFEASVMLEGVGYVCAGSLIIKRFAVPVGFSVGGFTGMLSVTTYVTILGIVFPAAILSSSAPFVVRPNWFRERAGRLGAGLLAATVLAGASMGLALSPPGPSNAANHVLKDTVKGTHPCAKDFPRPATVIPVQGTLVNIPAGAICTSVLRSSAPIANVVAAYLAAFREKGWAYEVASAREYPTALGRNIRLTGPVCGAVSMTFSNTKKGSHELNVQTVTGACSIFGRNRPTP